MDEKLEAEAIVVGQVANGGNEAAAHDEKLVSLLETDFASSDSLDDALGKHGGERLFIPPPFGRRHLAGLAEFAALANDPAFQLGDKTRGRADEKTVLRL